VPSRRLVGGIVDVSLENSIARGYAYLAQTAAKLLEVGELEERLGRVEAALGPRLVKERRR
jgi:hypothetical protein